MKIGLVCGSVSDRSANAALLSASAPHLHAAGHTTIPIDGFATIPAFDAALVDSAPRAVDELRAALHGCDAVLLAAPEYAAGVSGSTKNALDWLVGDSTLYRKVVGVASAGTTGGPFAIEQLVRTISWQGGWVVSTLGIASPKTKSDANGEFDDPGTLGDIRTWCDTVVEAVDASADQRFDLLAAVLPAYGIDPSRFGSLD